MTTRDGNEVVLAPIPVLALRPEALRPGVRKQKAIRARRCRTAHERLWQRAEQEDVLLGIATRLGAGDDRAVDVPLADAEVVVAKILGGVMAPASGEDLPRSRSAVREPRRGRPTSWRTRTPA